MKTVTDGLAAEVTNRQNADTALSDRIGTIPAGSTGQGHHLESDKSLAENLVNLDTALGEIADNAVVYDGTDKSKVTLGGTDGTTIDKVQAATLDANSKEAVNGSQLFQTNQALDQEITDRTQAVNAEKTAREAADTAINNKIGSIDENGNYIDKDASVFSNLSALDTQVKANADALTQEIQDRTNADTEIRNQITQIAGNSVNYDGEDKSTVSLGGTNGTTLANVKDGTLAEGSKEAVTGGQLYTTNQALAQEVQDRTDAVNDLRDDLNDLTGNAVTYDGDDKSKVTLGGGENGTTISNVKDAALAEGSKC